MCYARGLDCVDRGSHWQAPLLQSVTPLVAEPIWGQQGAWLSVCLMARRGFIMMHQVCTQSEMQARDSAYHATVHAIIHYGFYSFTSDSPATDSPASCCWLLPGGLCSSKAWPSSAAMSAGWHQMHALAEPPQLATILAAGRRCWHHTDRVHTPVGPSWLRATGGLSGVTRIDCGLTGGSLLL